jgi:NAD(P)-dependent dehydrogenase (short-subunit alcohol dehydrogenase family)
MAMGINICIFIFFGGVSVDKSLLGRPHEMENQVAVVTGGARGIGAGIVRRFVEEGAHVVFTDLLAEKGKVLEAELGQDAAFYRADATKQTPHCGSRVASRAL